MDYRGMRVLVTGADGFIGSHVVERLVAAGASVTALSLYNATDSHGWLDDLAEPVREQVSAVRGDIRDPGFMLRLCEGQAVIFHLAALIAIPFSYRAAQSYVDVNVTGTVNLLEAARSHGAKRIIVTSTSEVYGTAQVTPITETHPLQAQSPYAATKIAADAMAEAYRRSFDLPVAILRPFNTYGPRQSERAVIPTAIRQALDPACTAIRIGNTAPQRDFTFVGDTADAFLAIGGSDAVELGTPYNAGSGRAVSIGETVDMIRALTGANKPVETEAERFRPDASEVGLLLADSANFTAATGWEPAVDLEAGLSKTVDWWRDRLAAGVVRPGSDYMV